MSIFKKQNKNFGEKKKSLATFSFCPTLLAVLFVFLCSSAFGQEGNWMPLPEPTPVKPKVYSPKPEATPAKPVYSPKPMATPAPVATPAPRAKRRVENTSEAPAEKTIGVDQRINISLCISSGKFQVNAWDRNEVRAFVDSGSSVGFKVLKTNPASNKPAWVEVLGYDPQKNKELDLDECLEGNIQLDVPFDTILNVKGKESDISIDSISIARIENVSGDINLSNIKRAIQATTFEGDITVERSSGGMNLLTSAGKIVVFDSSPNDVGETLRAKSRSGAIGLQNVSYNNLVISSLTGSLLFNGALESGGQYQFVTTSGKIELTLPMNTSCKVTATYGGEFETKIPFKDIHNYSQSNIRKVIALIGEGEATLTVTTYNGSILIKPNGKK
jgi:hypothetical protein